MAMYIVENDEIKYAQSKNTSKGSMQKGNVTLNLVTINSVVN